MILSTYNPGGLKCVHGGFFKCQNLDTELSSTFDDWLHFWRFNWVQLPINLQNLKLTNQNAQKIPDLILILLSLSFVSQTLIMTRADWLMIRPVKNMGHAWKKGSARLDYKLKFLKVKFRPIG